MCCVEWRIERSHAGLHHRCSSDEEATAATHSLHCVVYCSKKLRAPHSIRMLQIDDTAMCQPYHVLPYTIDYLRTITHFLKTADVRSAMEMAALWRIPSKRTYEDHSLCNELLLTLTRVVSELSFSSRYAIVASPTFVTTSLPRATQL